MPRKRHYRKRGFGFKFKLRNNTVYSIFAFGLILIGLLSLLSFSHNGSSLVAINNQLWNYFGFSSYLFPFVLIFFGFFFLRLKFYLSRTNVSLGFALLFISIDAITKGGVVGGYLFQLLSDTLTPYGTFVVFIGGIVIGIVVLFDTSLDELVGLFVYIGRIFTKLFPKKLFAFLR